MARGARFHRRRSGLIPLLVAIAIVLAAPADAATVLWVGGTACLAYCDLIPGGPMTSDQLLAGRYAGDPLITVDYPASIGPFSGPLDPTLGDSIEIGTTSLKALAHNVDGPIVVAGTSQGAMVVQRAAADLNDDPTIPSDTTFILIADPNLGLLRTLPGVRVPVLDYTPAPLPQTRFHTVVVINQYDPFADSIQRPWNLLTDLNAVMAVLSVHVLAQDSDLSTVPEQDISTTTNSLGGTTTTYRVPTVQLPLTMPLRQLGVPDDMVDRIDASLRPVIDEGYLAVRPKSPVVRAHGNGIRDKPATATAARRPPGASKAAGSSARRH